jgi:protein-S-isoprenylcysteine O-methyltransferase Ste14
MIINLILMVLLLITPQIVSGKWNWWEAWLYAGLLLLSIILSRILAIRANPGIAKERMNAGGDQSTKSWDKFIVPLAAFYVPLITLLIAGLDERFGWSPSIPLWIKVIAIFLIIFGLSFSTWAMAVNAFFSSHVRIQADRGHHVVDAAPYKFIRHPAYFGGALFYISIPILLGSIWALIPALLNVILLICRTILEDRTLIDELPGYKEYSKETRFKWIPGLW